MFFKWGWVVGQELLKYPISYLVVVGGGSLPALIPRRVHRTVAQEEPEMPIL